MSMLDFIIFMFLTLACNADGYEDPVVEWKVYIHEADSTEALLKKVYKADDGKLCVELADDRGHELMFNSITFYNLKDCADPQPEAYIHKWNIHTHSGTSKPEGAGPNDYCYSNWVTTSQERLLITVTYKIPAHNSYLGDHLTEVHDAKYYVPSGSEWCDICPSGYQATFGSSNMVGECQQHDTNQGESGKIVTASIEQCKAKCDEDHACVAFDWMKGRCYLNSFCEKQDSDDYFSCMKEDYSNVLERYEHNYQDCINGENIIKYTGKTIKECSDLCDLNSDCLAFEYGVDHGTNGGYDAKDCQLQSASGENDSCDGQDWNLDLYVKKGRRRLMKLMA